MSVTTTPRFGASRPGAGTDPFSRVQFVALLDQIEALAAIWGQGTLAARPAASKAGRFYRVSSGTSAGSVWWDDGTDWQEVNPAAPAAISPTLVDAKGDLIVGTADNTVARLARGATDQLLATAADGSLTWIDKPSGGAVINTRIDGSALVSAGGTTTVTITAVNVAKCQVRLNTSFTAQSNGWATISVHLGSSTSLVITAAQASTSYTNVPVYYEIVEWT